MSSTTSAGWTSSDGNMAECQHCAITSDFLHFRLDPLRPKQSYNLCDVCTAMFDAVKSGWFLRAQRDMLMAMGKIPYSDQPPNS